MGFNEFSAGVINNGGMINGNAEATVSGRNFNVADAFFVLISNDDTGSHIGGMATLNLTASNITVIDSPGNAGNGFFQTEVLNEGGAIVGAATVNVNVAGQLSADFVDADITNIPEEPGKSNQQQGGSTTIGSDAIITFQAGQVVGGGFSCYIDNRGGGQITGNATINTTVGSFSGTNQFVDVRILNNWFLRYGLYRPGGIIGGNATVNLNTTTVMADGLFAGIFNNNNSNPIGGSGGAIGGGAFLNVGISGDTTTSAGAEFDIYNNDHGSGSSGGTIGTDTAINVSLGNITSGPEQDSNALVVQIDNTGGSIGRNAMIDFAASGNVDAQGNAFLQILNFNDGGNAPGTIGGDAVLTVSAGGDISTQNNLAIFQIRNDEYYRRPFVRGNF